MEQNKERMSLLVILYMIQVNKGARGQLEVGRGKTDSTNRISWEVSHGNYKRKGFQLSLAEISYCQPPAPMAGCKTAVDNSGRTYSSKRQFNTRRVGRQFVFS